LFEFDLNQKFAHRFTRFNRFWAILVPNIPSFSWIGSFVIHLVEQTPSSFQDSSTKK